MKKIIILLLSVLCIAATTLAYDFQSGDLCYNIKSDNTVEVTYLQDYKYNYRGLTTATIPKTVTYNGTTYSVTSIGRYAFRYCSSLTSITLPNSVTSIEDDAFRYCSSLTSITLPNSVTSIGYDAFSDCTSLPVVDNLRYADTYLVEAVDKSLSTYTIKAGTKWIGIDAFDYCSALTSITIPNSVTSIGSGAFSSCSSLTSVILPNSITRIENYVFQGCSSLTSITLPNSVTSIGDNAFYKCSSLTSLSIPNSVTGIGERAFYNVPNVVYNGSTIGSPWGARSVNGYVDGYLVYADETKTNLLACSAAATGEISLPNSITSIGERAFYECSSLTSITIPNSVTSIGEYVFYKCSSLTSITLPNSVTSIGEYAFRYCSSLTSITIPNSVTSIGDYAFADCSSLTSITIPNSVTSIGDYAFYGCTSLPVEDNLRYADTYLVEAVDKSLSTYNIKAGTKWIGPAAFWRCSSLTSVTIPNSVTSIGNNAFQVCSSLTSITLPNSVTSIGYGAFSFCSSLTSLTLPNSVTSIGDNAFADCTSLPVEDNLRYADTYLVEAVDESLSTYTIKAGTKWIGDDAFKGCSYLTSISIPNSVTSIRNSAFNNCTSLRNITCLAVIPPTCEDGVFDNIPNDATLWCPCESIEAYQTADSWSRFNDIRRIDFPKITILTDTEKGSAQIDELICSPHSVVISATPYEGYVFTHWSDGDTENPRTVLLTQDTALTAEFGLIYSGKCGDNLYWEYKDNALIITGSGDMYDYKNATMPWLLFKDIIYSITLPQGITSIGDDAFKGCSSLTSISIPNSVTSIRNSAFNNCTSLRNITCLAVTPPTCEDGVFDNIPNDATLWCPCESIEAYQTADSWSRFNDIRRIDFPKITILTDTEKGSAQIDEWICTPQSVVISAMPYEGYVFTRWSDGDTENPRTVLLTQDTILTAEFAKKEEEMGNFNINEIPARKGAEKILRDGQVLILRNGVTYDMMGQTL